MKERILKVAGVTFNNEACDGGESRQTILMDLRRKRRIVDLDLVYTTFDGEPAIKVRERSTKKVIGWIPKTEVTSVMEEKIKRTIGFLGKYDGKEYVQIRKPQYPTNVEYHRMKKMCLNRGKEMPAYDRRAYALYEKMELA